MEDEETVQLCTRCSAVMDSNNSVLYCAACAVQGRAPPLVSGCRNTCDESVKVAELSDSCDVMSVVDNDGHAHTHSLDDTPQNVSPRSPELMDDDNLAFDCSSNSRSSVQESVIVSSDHLQDSDCLAQQSSVKRLRNQMEMLARDEDISVHCGITTEVDGAVCSEFGVNEIDSEDNLMTGDDDLIMTDEHQPASLESQQQLDHSPCAVSSDTVVADHSHNSTFNSARVNESAMSLSDASEMACKQAAVNGKPRRRKSQQSVGDEDDSSTCADSRCDCCSVLTHQKSQIHSAADISTKLSAAFAGWLVKCLLLLLLLALLLLIICSMKPGWCRLGLLVDWRLRHIGGSPPV